MAARGPQPKHAGKTPPLCMGDGCQVRVKRHYGVRLDIAPRVEDGVAWRRFCRRCNASNASTVRHGDAHKGAAATRLKKLRARVERAKVELGAFVDAQDRIPLIEAVRYIMKRERQVYTTGYSACWFRARRGTLGSGRAVHAEARAV
jgi:hypothetical protein